MWRYMVLSVCLVALSCKGSILPFENYHLNATVGGYAAMNCHLDFPFGHEIPYLLEWDKDGETIFSWYSADPTPPKIADSFGGRVQQVRDGVAGLGRGSINLTSVRETDNGLYHCRVLFPNRSPPTRNNGTYYYLEVEGGNLIATPPVNVTCMEGGRAEFECMPKSLESIIRWYKDGVPIVDLMDLAHRAILCDNGSLVIEHTSMTDLGEYECHVRNPDGELQSASAFLDVQYKAKVTYSPKERYLPYGKPARLDCHFSANPPLTNLRWEKDGFLFDSYNVPGVYYSRNGSLLFNQVDDAHAGLYSCTPYNALGTEGPSPAVKVHVLRPPKISPVPRPLYLARLGQPLTMVCGADGDDSPPSITWTRKDGVPLPEGRYFLEGGNLTLESVTEEDRGVYVCTAHNDAATTTAMAELMIENVPPRAPYNLTAVATTDSIHVKWVPGYLGPSVEYTVWYRPRAQSEWHTMKILSLGVTEGTLLGLSSNAEYEVRVLAQDHIGDGLFSKPIFVRTPEPETLGSEAPVVYAAADSDAVEEPPSDVTARAIAEGVLVTWAVGPEPRRCNLRWYRGPQHQLEGSLYTTNNYVLVSDVEEGEQYMFAVWCGDSPDVSDEAARVSLQVPAYSRLRTVAAAAGGAALLLAVIAAGIYFGRDRICALRDGISAPKCRR